MVGISQSTDRFNGVVTSLAIKVPCKVVSVANLTLSGEQTVNGIAVTTGDRVLVAAQTSVPENGIYDVTSTAWCRAPDWDGNRDATERTMIVVGTAVPGQNVMYQCDNSGPIVIGSTAVTFSIWLDPQTVGPSGTTIDSTLRYDGAAYVENLNFKIEASGRATLANDAPVRWLDILDVPVEVADFTAGVPGGAPVTDPDLASVVLLITSESDANGASGFTDDTGNHTFTNFESGTGIAEVSNLQAKFGSKSLHLDDIAGAHNAYFTTPQSTDFDLGSADFTMEFHFRAAEDSVTGRDVMGKGTVTGSNRQWRYLIASIPGDFRTTFIGSTDGTTNDVDGAQKLWGFGVLDTWYHIAICRDGNNLRQFVDGAQVGSTYDITGQTFNANTAAFLLLGADDTGSNFEYFFDNIRFTPGVARYTTGFTAPTAPYDGSASLEVAVWGDPSYDTRIDGSSLDIAGAYLLPVVDGSVGQALITDGAGNVTFGAVTGTIADGVQVASMLSWDGADWNEETRCRFSAGVFGVYDAAETDSVRLTVAGNVANFQTIGTNSLDVNTPEFRILGTSGGIFEIYDSTNQDYVQFAHNGSDFIMDGFQTGSINFTGLANGLRVFDSVSETDYVSFYHDDTDGWIGGLNSRWLRIESDFERLMIESGILGLPEVASAPADTATVGQIWARNDSPPVPIYTDDDGTDQLIDPSVSELNVQNGNYTLLITDKGKTIQKESGGAGETITIPANASVAFPLGTMIGISNDGTGDLSVAITTDVLEGTDGATGTRTLGDHHEAVIRKMTATKWKYVASDL